MALLLAALVSACASAPEPAPPEALPPVTRPLPPVTPVPPVGAIRPAALPGWNDENHLTALMAYTTGCGVDRAPAAAATCADARALLARGRVTPSEARAFFVRASRAPFFAKRFLPAVFCREAREAGGARFRT